jgi:hypothetical protein
MTKIFILTVPFFSEKGVIKKPFYCPLLFNNYRCT